MQVVLNAPGCALVIEIESVSTPGVADEVMDGTEAIECTGELTAEERMKPLPSGSG